MKCKYCFYGHERSWRCPWCNKWNEPVGDDLKALEISGVKVFV